MVYAQPLAIGSEAPDFTLQDEECREVHLSDFHGKHLVLLIFYPGDDTPGCVKQLTAVRDDQAEFDKRQVVVFGVNQADAASHQRFIDKYGLTTSLLADLGMKVSAKYGAVKQFLGHEIIDRTVVLVDKQGIIRYVKHGLPTDREIIDAIKTWE